MPQRIDYYKRETEEGRDGWEAAAAISSPFLSYIPMEGLTDEHLGLGDKLVGGDFHVERGGALADAACSKPVGKVFRVRLAQC